MVKYYSNALKIVQEDGEVKSVETIEAIPVEWLLNHQRVDGNDNILELIELWRKENG